MAALFADEVICVSERTRELMFDNTNTDADHVSVLHDAVPSPERFDELPSGDDFRTKCGIADDAVLVVQLSKLTRNKAQDRLLDVAARVEDDHPEIHFAIVGGSVDGHEDYGEELETRSQALGNVSLVGFYEDITSVLAAADILVHIPRYEDPFPGVVLEGMLARVPVIGARNGGIPEQIDDGETGILVPGRDAPEAIAEAIVRLKEDRPLQERLGETARSRVLERFPLDDYFSEIDTVYRRLMT
jgi:glycosyltransferase involved in cell wall biosynthesis